jgi:hypothetical protein
MKPTLLHALIISSFATLACSAGAQNATPRELPPGTPPAGVQNGTPVETPPTNAPSMKNRMTDDQIRQYMDARSACSSQPATQLEACNTDVNRKFGSVDAKCQKLSGPALADCLRGSDRGG